MVGRSPGSPSHGALGSIEDCEKVFRESVATSTHSRWPGGACHGWAWAAVGPEDILTILRTPGRGVLRIPGMQPTPGNRCSGWGARRGIRERRGLAGAGRFPEGTPSLETWLTCHVRGMPGGLPGVPLVVWPSPRRRKAPGACGSRPRYLGDCAEHGIGRGLR
jgi:hypothetical protein